MEFLIQHYPELESTNTLALELASQGEPAGLVITTDYQTGGRGKPGRTWESTVGKNLLFSILLRPAISINKAPMITQITCRAIAKVLEHDYQIKTSFKNPNDLMIGEKKICGTLVESSSSIGGTAQLEYVVIGVGLNVNAESVELPKIGTSMKNETGRLHDRNRILQQILAQLAADLTTLKG
ncbi:MAG: biotin--[acetyl-CoA-carboxylase] ligase [Candidatus Omnitrophica bacterium]|nr:biotin--[acetyl-CoA-carboxylase] ligase [Candidatus Omnitrophota bacterium]